MTPSLPDDYTESLVRDLVEQTGKPEAQVRAVCAELAASGLNDRATQWELCQTWGWSWEEVERVKALGIRDIRAVTQGIAARSLGLVSVLQAGLARRLPKEIETLPLKEISTMAKQQFDLAKSASGEQAASQHVHFHGDAGIGYYRDVRERQQQERPARQRLAAQGVKIQGEATA